MYCPNRNYEVFVRPEKPEGVDRKSTYIVDSGLVALVVACFLVRDGQMNGKWVHILERDPIPGGVCDGHRYDGLGYVIRGGREVGNHFECVWGLFHSIPPIETEGASALDGYYRFDKHDPNYSLMRVIANHSEDAHINGKFDIPGKSAIEIVKLFFMPDEELYDKRTEEVSDNEVLNSNS